MVNNFQIQETTVGKYTHIPNSTHKNNNDNYDDLDDKNGCDERC